MSDLSRVLGDLYGPDDQPSVAPPRNFRAEAPEWADEQRLDEAFAQWTPGPPPEAHAMEREMAVVIDTPPVPDARLDDDLAGALSAALVAAGDPQPEPELPMAEAPSYSIPAYGEDPALAAFPAPVTAPVPVAEEWVEPYPTPEVVAPVVPARPWARADDDILPGKGPAPKLPKQPKMKAPKAPKRPKAPKAQVDAAAAPVEAKPSRFKLTKGPKAPKAPKADAPAEPKASRFKLSKDPKEPKAPKAPKPEAGERQPVKVFGITVRK